MIQTINPYASARTAEIMSRYRPIAPKPETPQPENENSGVKKSPYMKNVWAHLQARPTRTSKRGRTSSPFGLPPSPIKRRRTCFQGLSPSYQAEAKNFAMHGIFTRGPPPQISLAPVKCSLDAAVTTLAETVALPLFCRTGKERVTKGIDLNKKADQGPEELDFLPQLQSLVKPSVISPRPVRPIGSSIVVGKITSESGQRVMVTAPQEVEEVVEAEEVPAIVSDSNLKVRMSNSGYKKMIGQPECGWLDCAAAGGGGGGACRRIGGEVSIRFQDSELPLLHCRNGFCCRVKIEWESEGKKCVNAYCEVVKFVCEAKDFQFLWRFRINETSKLCVSDLN
ncbi:hypothetical protein CDL12_24251 [Handroanthus impetiginosus]|uniref:Uncharacterized protein n=1 Tax=Handroanthus impetiginosus TaxID=429701 RepID=A0A2G9GDZ7_9LAMI|nr:hypothetical protein CDL12_24251 [Handroanthus impetiginosus]